MSREKDIRFAMVVTPANGFDHAIALTYALREVLSRESIGLDVISVVTAPGLAEKLATYCDEIHLIEPVDPGAAWVGGCGYVRQLADVVRAIGSSVVLTVADAEGRNASPALAWELGACLVTDCTALTFVDGRPLFARRRAFSDVIDEETLAESAVGVVTLAVDFDGVGLQPKPTQRQAKIVRHTMDTQASFYDGWASAKPIGPAAITESQILLGIGRGAASLPPESYNNVAALLGVPVAATRQAIEWNVAVASQKIGDTGLRVAPNVYLAIGISGANQHMSGLWGNPTIIAVNRNRYVPIFDDADVCVVADASEFLRTLHTELRSRLSTQSAETALGNAY